MQEAHSDTSDLPIVKPVDRDVPEDFVFLMKESILLPLFQDHEARNLFGMMFPSLPFVSRHSCAYTSFMGRPSLGCTTGFRSTTTAVALQAPVMLVERSKKAASPLVQNSNRILRRKLSTLFADILTTTESLQKTRSILTQKPIL